MKYSDILAAIIHDVKNSLAVVVNQAEELQEDAALPPQLKVKAGIMEQEIRRANNHLIQILTLYKLDNQRLTPVIDEYNVLEFLEEILLEEASLAQAQDIELSLECDEWLTGYFDHDLVRTVLASTIGNAKRYTRSRIQLSAEEQDNYLVLRIEDDGAGFGEEFLQSYRQREQMTSGLDLAEGRTHLGFFFADKIATAHHNGERRGFIRLGDGRHLPGGCFELWLP